MMDCFHCSNSGKVTVEGQGGTPDHKTCPYCFGMSTASQNMIVKFTTHPVFLKVPKYEWPRK